MVVIPPVSLGNHTNSVYLYCSCGRDYVFHQFSHTDDIQFRHRFNGEVFTLTESQLKLFCELTVTNELELVYSSDDFKAKYGFELVKLFQSMDTH
ncbi:hypothetical protein QWZ16_22820 [Vibrio ostreicida]|uniref:Uncharacterized protein n=1 Tax=Vibrio ostreicida TaxID=526588 RepID=A0ABT8BZB2_9VIBR|nr:hypothetical protein [Vibrio ostreicida]MDN3612436.1 hypothetical protein [Vibrio ostreicida]